MVETRSERKEQNMETKIPADWLGRTGPIQDLSLNVSISHGLREAIRAEAAAEGVTVSYWMRRAAVAQLERAHAQAAS